MPAAVNLLERSVSLLPSSDPEHPDLLLKLGIALAESGEVGRADALLSERIREERRGLPFLSYRDGAGKQQIFDLDAAVSRVRIGRKPSNDIPLEWDAEVSRTHASILKVDDRWVLIDDERSRNGSFVNGQHVIDRHVLEDGDILRFGETLILYRSPVATDVLARGRMDPRSTTATATGVPTAVFLSETQRSVLLALCGLLEEGGATSGAAADEEIAKQLSLDVQAVRENLWALSHVFDTEELPGDEGVALLVERARANRRDRQVTVHGAHAHLMTTGLDIGSEFAGHRVDALAGRGGMGVIFRATHLRLGRTVALKLVASELAQDASRRERFKRESRIAASIDHPNVIPLYEAGEEDGTLFISMRWVDGTDLRAVIDSGGPLEPARASRLIAQIASALDAAHARDLSTPRREARERADRRR